MKKVVIGGGKFLALALAVLLVAAIAYIAVDKVSASQRQGIAKAASQGYSAGVADVLATAYQQTGNCQVTTITLGNFTRRIVDFDCVQLAVVRNSS